MEQKQKNKKKQKREKTFPWLLLCPFFFLVAAAAVSTRCTILGPSYCLLCASQTFCSISVCVCVCCIPSTTFFRLRQIDTSTYSSPPSLPNRKQIRWSEIELVACLRNWLPTSSPFLFLIWTTAKACMGFYTRPSHRGQDNLRECYGPGLPEANKIPVGRT